MASGREARAERLNDRLRGAQRVNVGDDSFHLDIAAAPEAAPSSSPAKPTARGGRADRLNERLRGAQRANVADDNFNLDIAAPPRPAPPRSPRSPAKSTEPTARGGRADRLNERLRGAQRVNVTDDDFNLNIDAAPASSSSPAKRRKLDSAGTSEPTQAEPRAGTRRSPRTRDPYYLPATSKTSAAPGQDAGSIADGRPSSRRSAEQTSDDGFVPIDPGLLAVPPDADDMESLPTSVPQPTTRPAVMGHMSDEIEESPAHAPGSGRRISNRVSGAIPSSARLQEVLQSEDNTPMPSSPLTRKSRRSGASVRSSRGAAQTPARSSPIDEVDELSPDVIRGSSGAHEELRQETPHDDQEEEGPAEEIGVAEAAETIGRKRPRQSPQRSSPQLGSRDVAERPQPKRGQKAPARSPATQKQGAKPKPKATKKPARRSSTIKTKPKAKAKGSSKAATEASPSRRRISDQSVQSDAAIELTVQRFVNHRKPSGVGEDDTDPLQLEIPFANRSGESAVDVFAQVCDEVIGHTLEQYQDMVDKATDAAKKKEFRIKVRAVEAYREVLNSRLLQHTIHLDHWNSLRKRLRHAQKEKLVLREEIIRLKAEREQVALRMDAVRIKHEADTEESSFLLNTSSTMRDIDMAVEKGREAPSLPAKALKEAELANLELVVAQISDQASPNGATGGLLSQIQDFTSFLERAAVALESR